MSKCLTPSNAIPCNDYIYNLLLSGVHVEHHLNGLFIWFPACWSNICHYRET